MGLRVFALYDHEKKRHCTILVACEEDALLDELLRVDVCRDPAWMRKLIRKLNEILSRSDPCRG